VGRGEREKEKKNGDNNYWTQKKEKKEGERIKYTKTNLAWELL
jgi:hypothetical protein